MILPVRHMSVRPRDRAGQIADGHGQRPCSPPASGLISSSRHGLFGHPCPEMREEPWHALLLSSNQVAINRVTRPLCQADRNQTSG
jgi:hypothetical protein